MSSTESEQTPNPEQDEQKNTEKTQESEGGMPWWLKLIIALIVVSIISLIIIRVSILFLKNDQYDI